MELIRRIILVAGFLTGLWLCTWATPHLFRVDPVDWEKHRRHKESNAKQLTQMASETLGRDVSGEMDVYAETRLALDAFIAHETTGTLITVDGAGWEGFFTGVSETVLDRAPSAAWAKRRARWPYDESLYFRTDETPLAGIAARFSESAPLWYVQVKGATRSEYLLIHRNDRRDLFSHAPPHLVFPRRTAGLACLLGAFLLYVLLPRRRPPEEGLAYSRTRTATLPDLLGLIMGGLFFCIPLLVSQSFSGDSPFSPGWIILTAVMWLLAAIGLSSCAVAAWYASLRVEVTPRGLDYTSIRGRISLSWADLDRVEAFEKPRTPPWLRKALFVVSLFNWRALGPALLSGGKEAGIRLIGKNGRSFSFYLTGLDGVVPLVGRLGKHGVPVDATVYELLGKKPGDPAFVKAFPPAPRPGIGFAVYGVLLCAIPASLLAITWPPAAPARPAGGLPEKPFAFPAEPDLAITWDTIRQEEAVLAELTAVNERMKSIGERMKTADAATRDALVKESGDCLAEVERLHKQFETIRNPGAAAEAPAP